MNDHVLQVVTSTDRRGAEVFALDLASVLRARGIDVKTVALAPGSRAALSVTVLGDKTRSPATLRALRRAARTTRVVVAHGGDTLSACAVALVGTGVPLVYRNIGDPVHWSDSRRKRWQLRMLLRRAARVVAVADGAASTLGIRFGVPADRIDVIPTGVSAERFVPADVSARNSARDRFELPPDATVVTIVAALSPEKDVGLAIDTIATMPDVTMLVVGDGPQRAALEAAARAGAPGRVRFVGSLDDTRDAYAATDVLLLTSRTEGLPAALVEAGMAAVPAVATDVGYVRDVVVDGVTGHVADRDVASVRRALEETVSRRDELGAAAREHCVASFELGAIADHWVELLDAQRR